MGILRLIGRFLGFTVLAVTIWYGTTFVFGLVWSILHLPYIPQLSNLINLMFLPIGFWIAWRFTMRSKLTRSRSGRSKIASGQILSEFLDSAGNKPYRKLVQYHMQKQSTSALMNACLGEIALLPKELRPHAEAYIDAINLRFGYDKSFWQKASCRDAFEEFISTAIEVLSVQDRIPTLSAAFNPENQELAFQLFQIPAKLCLLCVIAEETTCVHGNISNISFPK